MDDPPLLAVEPAGEGQGDLAALLRCLADSVAALADVQVVDISFHSTVTDAEDDLTMTVTTSHGARALT